MIEPLGRNIAFKWQNIYFIKVYPNFKNYTRFDFCIKYEKFFVRWRFSYLLRYRHNEPIYFKGAKIGLLMPILGNHWLQEFIPDKTLWKTKNVFLPPYFILRNIWKNIFSKIPIFIFFSVDAYLLSEIFKRKFLPRGSINVFKIL